MRSAWTGAPRHLAELYARGPDRAEGVASRGGRARSARRAFQAVLAGAELEPRASIARRRRAAEAR